MEVLILAAGFGTRLSNNSSLPKSLININGKCIIDYIFDKIEKIPNIKTVHILTNGKFYINFLNWIEGDRQNRNFKINLINNFVRGEFESFGAIIDLQFTLKIISKEDILLIAGDNFFGFGGETRVGITIGKKVDLLLGIDYHTLESFRTFNLVAGLKANMSHFRSKVKPFILGGFGLAGTITLFERSYISSAGSRSSTRLMIEFGGGVRLGRLVLRSKFVNIFASGNSVNFVPVNVGVMF